MDGSTSRSRCLARLARKSHDKCKDNNEIDDRLLCVTCIRYYGYRWEGNRAKDSSSIVERTSLQAFSVMTFRVVGADTKAIIPSIFLLFNTKRFLLMWKF